MLLRWVNRTVVRQPLRVLSKLNHTSAAVAHDDVADVDPQPKYSKIAWIGAPGSGKGSYSSLLAPMLGVAHLSPGEMIRAEVRVESALGMEALEYTRKGELLPIELIARVMAGAIGKCEGGFLLDGFPRNWEQAKLLDKFTELDKVVHIVMRTDVIKTKLAGRRLCSSCGVAFNIADVNIDNGNFVMPPLLPTKPVCIQNRCVDRLVQRDDDTPTVIERRLQIYAEETELLVDHYRKKGIVTDVHIIGGKDMMIPIFQKALGITDEGDR